MAQRTNGLTWLTVVNLAFSLSTAAWAQTPDLGKSIFISSCASCHGIDGKGKGPLAAQLKAMPSDLTALAKNNGGVLPVSALYEVIDGRKTYAAHGTREMPVWGDLFAPLQSLNLKWSDQYTYLNRLQEK